MTTFSAQQHREISLLTRFYGKNAQSLYCTHDRSLSAVLARARNSRRVQDARFVAGIELAQALLAEELRTRECLNSPSTVREYLRLQFAGQGFESFVLLYLNSQNQLIDAEELFRGTLSQTAVFPREVVKRALSFNAAAVICAHPHPSGLCEPSRADEALTQALKQALALVEVKVLDHIIVAGNHTLSFAERGLL